MLLDIRETVAKLVVQTFAPVRCGAVYTELFDYGKATRSTSSRSNGLGAMTWPPYKAQLAFEEASVIGVIADGVPMLNSVGARRPQRFWSHADRCGRGRPDAEGGAGRHDRSRPACSGTGSGEDDHPTRALLIGWNERAGTDRKLRELDNYGAPPGARR